jgi:hypothetical protein
VTSGVTLYLAMSGAVAGVVVVVSAENRTASLTSLEIEDIFLGRRNTFPNGEPVEPIEVDNLTARKEFYNIYLKRTVVQVRGFWARQIFTGQGRPPRSVPNAEAALNYIAEHPNAVSYVDSSLVDDRVRIVHVE